MKPCVIVLALLVIVLEACSPASDPPIEDTRAVPAAPEAAGKPEPVARYLYVWARDRGMEQTDFFSVFDADPASGTYGQLLSTVPMDMVANAHHSEHFMPQGNRLFMNGFMTGNSFVVNVANPHAPVVEAAFTNAGPYTYPHSFERIPGGNALATFQNMGEPDSGAGGHVSL